MSLQNEFYQQSEASTTDEECQNLESKNSFKNVIRKKGVKLIRRVSGIFHKGSKLRIFDSRYIYKTSDLGNFSFVETVCNFQVGDLVEITDERDLFGRIQFFISYKDSENFIGIQMNDDLLTKLKEKVNWILFTDNVLGKPFNGILVSSVHVQKFSYPLEHVTPPLLCQKSFRFIEEATNEASMVDKFIKFSMDDVFTYGKVKNELLINKVHCYEVSLIKYGSVNGENEFLVLTDTYTVKNLQSELIFYDEVVIGLENILTMEPFTSADWRRGDEAHFVLRRSGERISGKVECLVKINDVPSALIEVDETENQSIYHRGRLNKDMLVKLNCPNSRGSYLIPISQLQTDQSKELLGIIKSMLENKHIETEKVINEATKMKDESILPFLINNTTGEIDLEKTPELLNKLFERKDFESLKVLLTKSRSGESSDLIFLELGCKCLESQNKELFAAMIDKCSNRNLLLQNNETFLTNLFKTNLAEDVILDIIRDDIFDIAQSNGDGETPLMLACHNLWLPSIEVLLKSPKMDQQEISKANKIILYFDTNMTLEEEAKKFRAARLLKRDLSDNVCSICMDRVMDVSLSCGHRFCQQCSNKIVKCAICKKVIEGRTKLYN